VGICKVSDSFNAAPGSLDADRAVWPPKRFLGIDLAELTVAGVEDFCRKQLQV
jgi:hypothetical protein